MKTAVSQICISLLFSICSISLLKAQEYGENFNSVDVAVLKQIKSQERPFLLRFSPTENLKKHGFYKIILALWNKLECN